MSPVSELADLLLAARQGRALSTSPPDVPWADAYAVQAAVLGACGAEIGGWKVAIGPEGVPVAAPLFGATILESVAEVARENSRTCKIETEIGFRLAQDLPRREAAYRRADIEAAIASIHSAFEVVTPRLGEPGEVPFSAFLADNLGNGFTILGKDFKDFPERGEALTGRLLHNGVPLAEGRHAQTDPLLPLLLWANRQADALGGLRRGQIVITGSFTGALPVVEAGLYEGVFEGRPPVLVTFTH